jgi:hypothetical protein
MKPVSIDSVVKHCETVLRNLIMHHQVPFDLLRYGKNFLISSLLVLTSFNCQNTAMVNADSLPQTAWPSSLVAEALQEAAMRPATATQKILFQNATEADDDVAMISGGDFGRADGKTPQPGGSSKRRHGNTVNRSSGGSLHRAFTAEQMDLVAEIS